MTVLLFWYLRYYWKLLLYNIMTPYHCCGYDDVCLITWCLHCETGCCFIISIFIFLIDFHYFHFISKSFCFLTSAHDFLLFVEWHHVTTLYHFLFFLVPLNNIFTPVDASWEAFQSFLYLFKSFLCILTPYEYLIKVSDAPCVSCKVFQCIFSTF